MNHPATLKDGSEVLIRPMTEDDLDGSYEFFRGGVEGIVVKMMRPQVAVQDSLHRFGFRDETTLRNCVRDIEGKRHDLIVMHCDLEVLWRELEDHLTEGDWQRAR